MLDDPAAPGGRCRRTAPSGGPTRSCASTAGRTSATGTRTTSGPSAAEPGTRPAPRSLDPRTGGRHHPDVDEHTVREWFGAYLGDFVALGRGDTDDVGRLLRHYGVPFLLGTDAGTTALTDEAQVLAMARRQVDGMRGGGYDRTEVLDAETVVLNRSCATHRAGLVRLRADGSEISRLEVTYLVTDRPEGRRISALVVHSPA